MLAEPDTGMGFEHGEDHREAVLPSQPTTARRGVPSDVGRDERLKLDQQRARALRRPRRPRCPRRRGVAPGEEEGGGVATLPRGRVAGHLEDADLVGRPEAVLEASAGCGNGGAPSPVEGEHRVDHVLDHARPRDLAVLGDVADEDDGSVPVVLAKRISPWAAPCAPG